MKVTKEKAADNRAALVQAAGRLFRERGGDQQEGGTDAWGALRPVSIQGGTGSGSLRVRP
jgi:hypothetical protein